MKATICDCCKRVVDVSCEMYMRTIYPRHLPNRVVEEGMLEEEIDICGDCYAAIGYCNEYGDLKKLIDKAKKRRRRR